MSPIQKLLVANRGEIAVRVLRTARSMGIATVAVYSEADARSPHVALADEAVCIGPAPAAQSYLNIERILDAARRSGANAVHPGYGFLSENAGFAEACTAAGLIFVGPSPQAIRAMGDKAQAKILMQQLGLPCIPGYNGEDQDDAVLAAQAEALGYPVMIKATAGGGGRGMRIVQDGAGFGAALKSARSEARNAFGSDRVIIERVVGKPRHIEIQVLIDQHGHGIYLGERDCSVQRRHQKVIEEATAPGVAAGLRERMGSASVEAAIRFGYQGVGTFEFLLDDSGEFYFMEMNTRLQVEHPVTEAITGIDLVEWQLRVAMGEALGFSQQDVRLEGHAIEVRLCAEDESRNFMPQSGHIDLWEPASSVRVDHALVSGNTVSPYYDSMLAKLIASGRTREDARRRLVAALRETVLFGIKTNRQTLIRCLEHPDFVRGGVATDFLQAHAQELAPPRADGGAFAMALAAAICRRQAAGTAPRDTILYLAEKGGQSQAVLLRAQQGGLVHAQIGDQAYDLRVGPADGPRIRYSYNGVDATAVWLAVDDRIHLQFAGRAYTFIDATYAPAAVADGEAADGRIRALSNGRVVAVRVKSGDEVRHGDDLLTVEAMKMEYTHAAPGAAKVARILVEPGQAVATGAVLVELELKA